MHLIQNVQKKKKKKSANARLLKWEQSSPDLPLPLWEKKQEININRRGPCQHNEIGLHLANFSFDCNLTAVMQHPARNMLPSPLLHLLSLAWRTGVQKAQYLRMLPPDEYRSPVLKLLPTPPLEMLFE